jgi:hypothetical protein
MTRARRHLSTAILVVWVLAVLSIAFYAVTTVVSR